MSPADWLTLIAERAPALRAAGVESLSLEGLSVTFSKQIPTVVEDALEDEEPASSDPLEDPALYPGGRVPGFKTDRQEDDEL